MFVLQLIHCEKNILPANIDKLEINDIFLLFYIKKKERCSTCMNNALSYEISLFFLLFSNGVTGSAYAG